TTGSRRRHRARSTGRPGHTAPPSSGAAGSRADTRPAGRPSATPSPGRSDALTRPVRSPSVAALYRKYRPQDFDEVVRQEAIVRTLKNAISSGQLRQAYLFARPRGNGTPA